MPPSSARGRYSWCFRTSLSIWVRFVIRQDLPQMNYPAASGGVSKWVCYLFYRSKLRGIKPYRFRIVLQMIRVIRVICEICGLNMVVHLTPVRYHYLRGRRGRQDWPDLSSHFLPSRKEGRKTQSACLPCGIQGYSTGAAENNSLLPSEREGYWFLPFFRKGKNIISWPSGKSCLRKQDCREMRGSFRSILLFLFVIGVWGTKPI